MSWCGGNGSTRVSHGRRTANTGPISTNDVRRATASGLRTVIGNVR